MRIHCHESSMYSCSSSKCFVLPDLGRMFTLFKRISKGLEPMSAILRDFIKKEGKEINKRFCDVWICNPVSSFLLTVPPAPCSAYVCNSRQGVHAGTNGLGMVWDLRSLWDLAGFSLLARGTLMATSTSTLVWICTTSTPQCLKCISKIAPSSTRPGKRSHALLIALVRSVTRGSSPSFLRFLTVCSSKVP